MPVTSGVWDRIAGNAKEFAGHVQKEWGKLTHNDVMQINGDREILAGKIQEKYGVAKAEAHRQIDEWANKLDQAAKK
jgi:uncharacterized protein YjbJ (UPF0337 family)